MVRAGDALKTKKKTHTYTQKKKQVAMIEGPLRTSADAADVNGRDRSVGQSTCPPVVVSPQQQQQ